MHTERFTALRKSCGWTIAQLAEMTGLQPTFISEFENGKRPNPQRETLEILGRPFNMMAGELLAFLEASGPAITPQPTPSAA